MTAPWMPRRVFLTGSSSGLASALLPQLCRRDDVVEVIGLDVRPTAFSHPKFQFQAGDIRAPDLAVRMRGCDALVHMAYAVMRGALSDEALHANNVGGALNVFRSAAQAGVTRAINLSSVSVYGPGLGMDEQCALAPAPNFTYAHHKAEIERELGRAHPGVVHLRSHLIFGRHAQPFLKQMCRSRVVITPPRPFALLQIVHEDDVADAVVRCLGREVSGAFNLAAPLPLSLPELVRHGRCLTVPLPLGWVRAAVALARRFGNRDEFAWLDVFDTALTVDCTRAERLLGWRAAHTPWQARQATTAGSVE
jgi:UDP-glucose 4-epimerase